MESFEHFKSRILKREGGRQARVRGSFGVYDIYKLIRKNGWYDIGRPLKEHEFYGIVRGINTLLAEEVASGKTVVFPSRMGRLELRKSGRGCSIVGGKLKVSYPVDWPETLKLWYGDAEALKEKSLLRREGGTVYRVKYCKHGANYANKAFYGFTLNRRIKRKLKENINKGIVDTLW